MSRRISFVLGGLALIGLGTMSGCCFTGNDRLDEVRADPSPNIDTLHQRPEDMDNKITVAFDENGRAFWEDLGRMWFTDRPSRLTREPHPHP